MGWGSFPYFDERVKRKAVGIGEKLPVSIPSEEPKGIWLYEPTTDLWVFVTPESPQNNDLGGVFNMLRSN
jgi:hypothetical protein